MKKILALALVFVTIFSFAACKKEEIKSEATTVNLNEMDDEYIQASIEAEQNKANQTTAVQEVIVTNAEGQTEIATEVVTEEQKGLMSNDAAEIAAFYNKAVAATIVENEAGEAYLVPKGKQTMVLSKNIDGDGAIGAILKVLEPAVDKALTKNSKDTSWIPGGKKGELEAGDIVKATAISKNGKTTLTIVLKEQVDGPDCDGDTAGPVARGIGTLGSIDSALNELGAELTKGRDTVKLTYKNASIKCVIDEETGRIVSGEWFYTVDIFIGDAQAKLGIPANLKNLTTAIDYKVVI